MNNELKKSDRRINTKLSIVASLKKRKNLKYSLINMVDFTVCQSLLDYLINKLLFSFASNLYGFM